MRVLLCGQKRFGRDVFHLVREMGHEVAAVVCPGDEADRLWIACQNAEVPMIAAGTLNAGNVPEGLDLIITAHSHDFIGRKTRHKANLGALGFHPSLLPLHRGRDAIRWAVRMKERLTGGTCYWLNDAVDGGPIAAQDWCYIRPEDDALSLWARELAPMGLRLFRQVLTDLEAERKVMIEQDAALATWEPSMDGAPRLFRPDLEMLGSGQEGRFAVVRERHV